MISAKAPGEQASSDLPSVLASKTTRKGLNPDELRDLLSQRPTVPFLTALAAIGVSETAGRAAYKRGELPFRVHHIGKRMRVPSADLHQALWPVNATPEAQANAPLEEVNR